MWCVCGESVWGGVGGRTRKAILNNVDTPCVRVCGESVWGGGNNKESYSQQRGHTHILFESLSERVWLKTEEAV